jgi:hypothetical protein
VALRDSMRASAAQFLQQGIEAADKAVAAV